MHSCPQLAADAHDGRVRRGQRRRRPDVRRRGAGRQRGRAGRPVRRPGRASCSTRCSARSGSSARDVFIANVAQVPPARQPRPAAAGDRRLPGLPVPPARADPAARRLHARQLRHQAAARRPRPASRGCTGARRCASIGPRAVRLYPLYHPAAALYTPVDARDAARRLRADPRAAGARPRPTQPDASAAEVVPSRRVGAGARAARRPEPSRRRSDEPARRTRVFEAEPVQLGFLSRALVGGDRVALVVAPAAADQQVARREALEPEARAARQRDRRRRCRAGCSPRCGAGRARPKAWSRTSSHRVAH